MEKNLLLKTEKRNDLGSKAADKIRKEGRIPVVLYGHKQDPVHLTVDKHDFVEGLHHHHGRVIDVQVGSKKETAMLKELQYDALGKSITHVDMVRVNITETVKVSVPVEFKGTAKGAEQGGIVETQTGNLEVECKVNDIPESIIVSIKEIDVNDSLHAGDIELPKGVKLITDPDVLILSCHLVVEAEAAAEAGEEEPIAPEVIGEKKEEEPEE